MHAVRCIRQNIAAPRAGTDHVRRPVHQPEPEPGGDSSVGTHREPRRYSPVFIRAINHGSKAADIRSSACSPRYPILKNMARRCATIVAASVAVQGRITKPDATGSVVRPDGVVTLARLNLPVFVTGLDFDLAERAVFGGIGGRVADGVLAAHFLLQLVEGLLQGHFAIHMEHVAAGVFRHLPQCRVAIPAEYEALPREQSTVDVIEAIDNGVGLLRGFDGLRILYLLP